MSFRNPEEGAEVKSPQVGLRLPRYTAPVCFLAGKQGPGQEVT